MREGKEEGRKELLDPAAGKVASLKTLQGGVSGGGRETHFFQRGSRVSLFINRPSFFLRIWSYVQQGACGMVAQAESTTIVSPAIKNMRCPFKFLTLLIS